MVAKSPERIGHTTRNSANKPLKKVRRSVRGFTLGFMPVSSAYVYPNPGAVHPLRDSSEGRPDEIKCCQLQTPHPFTRAITSRTTTTPIHITAGVAGEPGYVSAAALAS